MSTSHCNGHHPAVLEIAVFVVIFLFSKTKSEGLSPADGLFHADAARRHRAERLYMVQCSNCGTNNLDGNRFCANCGQQLAQQVVMPAPMVAVPVKRNNTVAIIVTIVLAIAIIGAAGFVALITVKQAASVSDGDYVIYRVSGTAGGTPISGTLQMTFIAVTSTSETLETTTTINGKVSTSSQTYPITGGGLTSIQGGISGQPSASDVYIDQESISSIYGTISVNHYRSTDSHGNATDTYQTVDTGFPIRMTFKTGTGNENFQMDITQTSLQVTGTSPSTLNNLTIIGVVTILALILLLIIAYMVIKRGPENVQMVASVPSIPRTITVCPTCGKPDDGSMFCGSCGRRMG